MVKTLAALANTLVTALLAVVAVQSVAADEYAIIVGSYADQTNAERARVVVETHLRQRGISAQVRLLPANGRTRVAVAAVTQNRQRLLQQLRQDKYPDAWSLALKAQAPPVRNAAPLRQGTERAPPAPPRNPPTQTARAETTTSATPSRLARRQQRPKPIAQPMQLDARLKGFASAADIPGSDWQLSEVANPTTDASGDLRVMLNKTVGPLQFQLHHSTALQAGDAVQWGQIASAQIDQVTVNDNGRLLDMTWQTDSGARHQWSHRIDRLSAQWRQGDWSITIGRQAVSWGSGIVFQPLDPFNPFAPTAVDRDYKNGDDLVLGESLLPNGHDLQVLHVIRRDPQQHIRKGVSSTAAKWHGYLLNSEFELIVAKHYDQDFVGLSVRQPVGPAVIRSDLAWRQGAQSGDRWRLLGIVNADVAFPIRDRMAYVFAEYFHNDFGMQRMPTAGDRLPPQLQTALLRGEVFNFMRDYLAVGASYQWHPLLTQSLSVISNLNDGSALLQGQIAVDAAQNQQLQFGYIGGYADPGDEFAPLPVTISPEGEILTQGGSDRYYLRWAWYF